MPALYTSGGPATQLIALMAQYAAQQSQAAPYGAYIDPGLTVHDTGTGTSRTTTVTVFVSATNDGATAPAAAWALSFSSTQNWTSTNAWTAYPGIPSGGPDEGARAGAVALGIAALLTTVAAKIK